MLLGELNQEHTGWNGRGVIGKKYQLTKALEGLKRNY